MRKTLYFSTFLIFPYNPYATRIRPSSSVNRSSCCPPSPPPHPSSPPPPATAPPPFASSASRCPTYSRSWCWCPSSNTYRSRTAWIAWYVETNGKIATLNVTCDLGLFENYPYFPLESSKVSVYSCLLAVFLLTSLHLGYDSVPSFSRFCVVWPSSTVCRSSFASRTRRPPRRRRTSAACARSHCSAPGSRVILTFWYVARSNYELCCLYSNI